MLSVHLWSWPDCIDKSDWTRPEGDNEMKRLNVSAPQAWVLSAAAVILTALPGHAGVVYTCDATISSGVCTELNSTISGLYTSVFSDVNAKIYISMGATGSNILGSNLAVINTVTYAAYKN